MKTISLKIDDELDKWLEDESRRLGRTKSELAREALRSQRENGGAETIHGLMRDVCGSIKNTPRDLSTNKKHLKGMGHARRPD